MSVATRPSYFLTRPTSRKPAPASSALPPQPTRSSRAAGRFGEMLNVIGERQRNERATPAIPVFRPLPAPSPLQRTPRVSRRVRWSRPGRPRDLDDSPANRELARLTSRCDVGQAASRLPVEPAGWIAKSESPERGSGGERPSGERAGLRGGSKRLEPWSPGGRRSCSIVALSRRRELRAMPLLTIVNETLWPREEVRMEYRLNRQNSPRTAGEDC